MMAASYTLVVTLKAGLLQRCPCWNIRTIAQTLLRFAYRC
jgi:hypothetical protein